MALICVYFIEGGALSSNTVLIAFEGFNFFNQYIFLPICMTLKGFITFLVNYYVCNFNTHTPISIKVASVNHVS